MGGKYILMVAAFYAALLLIVMLLLAQVISRFFLKNERHKKRLMFWTWIVWTLALVAYIVRILLPLLTV
jgi:hypothetical protein